MATAGCWSGFAEGMQNFLRTIDSTLCVYLRTSGNALCSPMSRRTTLKHSPLLNWIMLMQDGLFHYVPMISQENIMRSHFILFPGNRNKRLFGKTELIQFSLSESFYFIFASNLSSAFKRKQCFLQQMHKDKLRRNTSSTQQRKRVLCQVLSAQSPHTHSTVVIGCTTNEHLTQIYSYLYSHRRFSIEFTMWSSCISK